MALSLQLERFSGVVMTHEYQRMPDGRMYCGFAGLVTVASAEDVAGFTPTGHNSANWFARIEGRTVSLNLMGCQVRSILEGEHVLETFGGEAPDILAIP